ncbi:MAG: hypothetical protein M5R38_14075 [Candidatus Methylomirabilis sp.]|nr:hypothetical protein [Candidatus Methylomirabilis sp.]
MSLIALLLIPLIGSALIMLVRSRVWFESVHTVAALVGLAAGLMTAARVWQGEVPTAIGGLLRADGLLSVDGRGDHPAGGDRRPVRARIHPDRI